MILSLHVGGVTSVAALVLMSLLTTLLIDGSPLLDAGVMTFKFDASVGGKVENMLHCLSNLENPTTNCAGPNAQNVFTVTHAEYRTANVLTSVAKLVPDERQDQVFPVAISDALLHPHNPLSSLAIHVIFPDRTNITFEKVII